jgi:hypothetical protein
MHSLSRNHDHNTCTRHHSPRISHPFPIQSAVPDPTSASSRDLPTLFRKGRFSIRRPHRTLTTWTDIGRAFAHWGLRCTFPGTKMEALGPPTGRVRIAAILVGTTTRLPAVLVILTAVFDGAFIVRVPANATTGLGA